MCQDGLRLCKTVDERFQDESNADASGGDIKENVSPICKEDFKHYSSICISLSTINVGLSVLEMFHV